MVVNSVLSVLTDEYIDTIARKISELSVSEGITDTVKRLKKLLKENEEATANLVKALEAGKAVDVIGAQIEKRQAEKADLETQLAKERIQTPLLKYEQVRFFFEHFTKGDVNDINYRRALVDTFIGKIWLYDDKITILYNVQDGKIDIPLGEINGSTKEKWSE